MRRHLLSLFVLLTLAELASADVPPSWRPFECFSANRKFRGVVKRLEADSLLKPWEARWTLTVYEKSSNTVQWKTWYKHTGYPGGELSDDGVYFVEVEYYFYEDDPLVKIYKKGGEINTQSLTGHSFSISKRRLGKTSSHLLWLEEEDFDDEKEIDCCVFTV